MRLNRISTVSARRPSWLWRLATSEPGWPLRIALLTCLLILALPIILLAVVAVVVAAAVFALLALAHATIQRLRHGLPGRRDGRENVRVIERKDV